MSAIFLSDFLGLFLLAIGIVTSVLVIVVLFRLAILLPVLTRLAKRCCASLPRSDLDKSTTERLIDLDDLLRAGQITLQQFESLRGEILDEV
jgi:hypothetical protein